VSDLTQRLFDTVASSALITLPIVATIFVITRRLMNQVMHGREVSRYDNIKHEAVLSEMRASYEHRLADLTREMVATRARWEEANHLIISGQRNQPATSSTNAVDVDSFLKSYGLSSDKAKVIEDKIFVLTPFSDDEKETYQVIKSVCSEAGFIVTRGDEHRAEGDILPQIVGGIISSEIVIANISSRNANVFFELGIAMALGKPTLLISDTLSDVPFDIQNRRIIVFKGFSDLHRKLTSALLQTVRVAR